MKDKEKEVARLRALQERDRDHKAEQVKYYILKKNVSSWDSIVHLQYQLADVGGSEISILDSDI